MVECRCMRNLVGFASSRPPCVAFTVCLAAFAVGLLSLGYYVHENGLLSFGEKENKEWKGFIMDLQNRKFCLFDNNTEFTNVHNLTNKTVPGEVLVPVPITVLVSLLTKKGFMSTGGHVTHLTALTDASEVGISSVNFVNMTISLSKPWETKCKGKRNCEERLVACAVLMLPKDIVPKHFLYSPNCNVTAVHTMAHMHSQVTPGEWCYQGIETSVTPALTSLHPSSIQIDEHTVNLRLQYSSYFLFVMVITCVLYGMIKGKPLKNGKKMSQPI